MAGYINGSVGKNSSRFTYRLYCEELEVNNSANTSKVKVTIQIVSGGSSLWASRSAAASHTITINGKAYGCSSGAYKLQGGTTVGIASVTSDAIEHDNNGSKTVSISASSPDLAQGNGYGPYSGSASGNFSLTTIPRYANLTSLTLKSRTINTLTFSFASDKTCNLYAKIDSPISTNWLNNGQPIVSNKTSGDFTISYKNRENTQRLDSNTTYNFTILCRNTTSGLDTSKTISGTTYNFATITNAPNFNDEENPTITYTNPFGNSVTTLQACISFTGASDDIVYRDISKTGNSYTFSFTNAERIKLRQNCSGNSRGLKFFIRTAYNGVTYHHSVDRTMSLINYTPTMSADKISYKDTNSTITNLTGSNQIFLNGYSNVQVTIGASAAQARKEASITSYIASVGDKSSNALSYSTNAQNFNTINNVNSGAVKVTATDSRGYSVTVSKNADIRYWSKPVISMMQVNRSNNGVGEEVILKFSGYWWNHQFGNTTATANQLTTIQYYYKNITNNGNFQLGTTSITFSINGEEFNGELKINGDNSNNNFSITSSYIIKLVVKDKMAIPAEYEVTLGTGAPALALYNNRVAIGQKYDTSEGSILQVAGDVNIKPASGNVAFLKMNGKKIIAADATNSALSANGGNIYLNPKGDGVSAGQVRIDPNGIIYATSLGSRGNVTAQTNATKPSSGLSMQNAYNNGYPFTYGNVINMNGGGASQLFLGWQGNNNVGPIYYRSMRDYTGDGSVWSSWACIPESRDNSVRYFRAGTIGTWNSNYSGYYNGTIMFCW